MDPRRLGVLQRFPSRIDVARRRARKCRHGCAFHSLRDLSHALHDDR